MSNKVSCKIDKWHALNNVMWKDYFIDEEGKVWHNDKEVEQFSYTVYCDKRDYADIRPYVILPSQRGSTKVPVHILQMQSNQGYKKGYDVCHLDGDKFNCKLSNLKYMTRSEHRKYDGVQCDMDDNGKAIKRLGKDNVDLSYKKDPHYREHSYFKDGVWVRGIRKMHKLLKMRQL